MLFAPNVIDDADRARPEIERPEIERPAHAASSAGRRCAALRRELVSPDLSFLMEAHDGLSAKLVEEAGFPAIWASGLAISAALGVAGNNQASWPHGLHGLEFIAQ